MTHVQVLGSVCRDAPVISLPVQAQEDWALLLPSPAIHVLAGQVFIALLGELDKINPVSPARVKAIQVSSSESKSKSRLRAISVQAL